MRLHDIRTQYKKTLTNVHIEEMVSLIVYRPIGFVMAYLLKGTPITPNQITLFKAFLSIVGAFCLYFWSYPLAGALLLLINLLDHTDGQLARLKNLSSTLGKALDDMSDYMTFSFYYLAASCAFARDMGSAKFFFLGAIAGLSGFVHTVVFDNYIHRYCGESSAEGSELEREQQKYTTLLRETSHIFQKLAYAVYLFHIKAQLTSQGGPTHQQVTTRFVRFVSFLGPITHLTSLAVFTLFGKLGLHFVIISIFLNLYLGMIFVLRKRLNQPSQDP